MKKFSSKIILGLLFICILAIGTINPIKVSAKDINPYKTIMEEYLNAFKNFDIDTIVKISKDKRVNDEEQYREMLEEFKNDPNQQLKYFEIINSERVYNQEIFNVKTEFINGAVYDMKFTVSPENGNLIVSDMEREKIENEGTYIVTPSMRAQVCTWDSTMSAKMGSDVDYRYSSLFTYYADIITLNFRQYSTSGSRSLSVKYSVVDHWAFGDDYKASEWVYGENRDYADQIKIRIAPGQSFYKYRIKIENYSPASIRVFGEGYCY